MIDSKIFLRNFYIREKGSNFRNYSHIFVKIIEPKVRGGTYVLHTDRALTRARGSNFRGVENR